MLKSLFYRAAKQCVSVVLLILTLCLAQTGFAQISNINYSVGSTSYTAISVRSAVSSGGTSCYGAAEITLNITAVNCGNATISGPH